MARRTRISLLSCALALAFAGCGSGDDGTIPPDQADNLLNLLAAVEQEAASGDCVLAQGLATQFVTSVNDLPSDVDPKVADELTKAATNLEGLTKQPGECTETGASGAVGEQSTTSTTETVTPETTTEESTTTESTTTLEPPADQPGADPNQEPPTGGDQGAGGGSTGSPSGGVTGGGSAG